MISTRWLYSWKFLGCAIAVLALGASTVISQPLDGPMPPRPRLGAFENESTYIVGVSSTGYYVRDGLTGDLDDGFTTADAAINAAIEATFEDGAGGRVFIKQGTYTLASRIDIRGRTQLTLEGSEGAVLTAPTLTGAAVLIDTHSSHITLRSLSFRECGGIVINLLSGTDIRIQDCSFSNVQSAALQVRIGDDPEDPVENLRVVGNTVSGASLGGGGTPAFHVYRTHDALFADNIIENCDGGAINVQRSSGQVVIRGNIIRDNGLTDVYHGIYVGSGSENVVISDNLVVGSSGNGLEAASGTGLGRSYVIKGNVFRGNGRLLRSSGGRDAGIYVTGSGHVVSENVVESNWGPGIKVGYSEKSDRILVSGNSVRGNGLGGAGYAYASGIVLVGPSVSGTYFEHVVVRGNLITDTGSTQPYGVYIAAGADGLSIEDNYLDGHDSPQIGLVSVPTMLRVRGNRGFLDSSRGSLSLTPGGVDSGSVDVDLATTLDIDDLGITLSPQGFSASVAGSLIPSSAGVMLRTEHVGGTTFRIYWKSDGAVSGLGINWSYAHNP